MGPFYENIYLAELGLSLFIIIYLGFPVGSEGKESAYNLGDPALIPGSETSPGEGNGNPLRYSYWKNPVDRGAWWATVHRVTKSWTQLK